MILLIGIFAMAEIALVTARRARLQVPGLRRAAVGSHLRYQGNWGCWRVTWFL